MAISSIPHRPPSAMSAAQIPTPLTPSAEEGGGGDADTVTIVLSSHQNQQMGFPTVEMTGEGTFAVVAMASLSATLPLS